MSQLKQNHWVKLCAEHWDINDCQGGTVGKSWARLAYDCMHKYPELQKKLQHIELDHNDAYQKNQQLFNSLNILYLAKKPTEKDEKPQTIVERIMNNSVRSVMAVIEVTSANPMLNYTINIDDADTDVLRFKIEMIMKSLAPLLASGTIMAITCGDFAYRLNTKGDIDQEQNIITWKEKMQAELESGEIHYDNQKLAGKSSKTLRKIAKKNNILRDTIANYHDVWGN